MKSEEYLVIFPEARLRNMTKAMCFVSGMTEKLSSKWKWGKEAKETTCACEKVEQTLL